VHYERPLTRVGAAGSSGRHEVIKAEIIELVFATSIP
jgi:hypothetical protein